MSTSRELVFALRSPCERVRTLAAWGTSGREIAADLDIPSDSSDVSPFAALAGGQFERKLIAESAAALSPLYFAATGVKVTEVVTVEDQPGDQPLEDTAALLNSPQASGLLIYQGQVRVNVAGGEHVVKPDLLFWTGVEWRVGEIKAYLVEAGFEDQRRLGDAVAQAALGQAGCKRLSSRVADVVDVFRHDRFAKPVWTQAVIAIWAEHLDRFADASTHIRSEVPLPTCSEDLAAISNDYGPACETHCGLAATCRL